MTSDLRRAGAIALILALAGCETTYPGPPASKFGDANRMTNMAQVVDPAPQYDTLNPPTSGEHAGKAAERYRQGAVKQPEAQSAGSSGSGSGSPQ